MTRESAVLYLPLAEDPRAGISRASRRSALQWP